MGTRARLAAGVIAMTSLTSGLAGAAVFDPDRTSGTLNLRAELNLQSQLGACPVPPSADGCATRTISGPFPGLGRVTGSYSFIVKTEPPPCDVNFGKALAYPIRFTVASKGDLQLDVAEAPCVAQESIRTQTQTFTVTGGTGIYAGASGSGTLEHVLGEETGNGRFGRQTWTGTLTVPGLEFDVTRPTIAGAANRVVRAKRGAKAARVVFRVTAQDDRDGALATRCTARSGSKFKVGRSRVSCSATDSSANTATAAFTVTVRRAR